MPFCRLEFPIRSRIRHGFQYLQRRALHLHEFQSAEIMKQYGAKVARFAPATTPREAEAVARTMAEVLSDQRSNSQPDPNAPTGFSGGGGDGLGTGSEEVDFVVKAQVLTGGRGLGYFKENGFQGGVHVCTSPAQVREVAKQMIGNTLVTKQTGPEGKRCDRVMVAERLYIRKERYFCLYMDRDSGGPVLLGSSVGGTSIEDIAAKDSNAILKQPIDITVGLTDSDVNDFVQKLGFVGRRAEEAKKSILALYRMFVERDCLIIEINPLAETHDGRVLISDAKVEFDDHAEFRQKGLFDLRDESQQDLREVTAKRSALNYVGLDGNIGCMVNGAGLAMATMDVIQLHGGKPANFLDVGGGANNEQVMQALKLLQQDKQVNAILINIFGGIMRCDTISLGLIRASQVVGLSKPMVVRLEGTKKEEAKELLESAGMKISFESDFSEAAKKAVKMAQIIDLAKEASLDVSFAL